MDLQAARLTKILSTWESRAQVRQNSLLPADSFDETKQDFLPRWLPFHGHPTFEALVQQQPGLLERISSAAWLQYNQVTLDIENDIVVPLCVMLQDDLRRDEPYHTLVVQAMIDESYHVLLTAHACAVTRRKRQLEHLHVNKSHLVQAMQRCQAAHGPAEQRVIQLATGIVTEVFIGAYLADIAYCKDPELQPFNVLVTKSHMIDEAVHGFVFAALAERLIPSLAAPEREFFWAILPQTVLWFFAGRCTAWSALLPQLGVDHMDEMLDDCRKQPMQIFNEERWTIIEDLAIRLGCTDFRQRLIDGALQSERTPTRH